MLVAYGMTALTKSKNRGVVDGIGQYSYYLSNAIERVPCCELLYASHVASANQGGSVIDVDLGGFKKQVANSVLTKAKFDESWLPARKPVLFHATDHYIPRYENIPVVATIHDVIPFDFPHWFSFQQRSFHAVLKRTMEWPVHFITVSNYSKNRILQQLDVPECNVSVVQNGLDPKWRHRHSSERVQAVLQKYRLERPYILFVGTIQKRKNLSLLLKAAEMLPQYLRESHEIVVVGGIGKQDQNSVRQLFSAIDAKQIKWLEYRVDSELVILMQAARCFVFPSLAEGFGLPVVEAFAAGTPVLASNATSIPEVAGNAAILFHPQKSEELAAKLADVLSFERLRSDLAAKGLKRSQDFSWEKSAAETVLVYKSVIDGCSGNSPL